jgi:hypothetical protein
MSFLIGFPVLAANSTSRSNLARTLARTAGDENAFSCVRVTGASMASVVVSEPGLLQSCGKNVPAVNRRRRGAVPKSGLELSVDIAGRRVPERARSSRRVELGDHRLPVAEMENVGKSKVNPDALGYEHRTFAVIRQFELVGVPMAEMLPPDAV